MPIYQIIQGDSLSCLESTSIGI